MHRMKTGSPVRNTRGFTLVELMVALALGLVLSLAVSSVYLFTKSAFTRQDQLASLQQSVRTAFEYLDFDARMAGHLGCYTGNTTGAPSTVLSTTGIDTNYGVGIEGYEYNTSGNAYTLGSNSPANTSTAGNWKTNSGIGSVSPIPVTTIDSGGLTPGSDVLVIRTVVGRPLRLTADVGAAAATIPIEVVTGGKCSDGTTNMVSGFCATSHGLIASCTNARTFKLTAAGSTGTLTVGSGTGPVAFAAATTEVFPMQTVVYYLKTSANSTTISLWRRVFNGDPAAGQTPQELIEGVESMQLRYGLDTTTPDPDGTIDSYVTADGVTDWGRVVSVRMSLLLHAPDAAAADVAVPASGIVNDVTITYPTSGSKYDRRVFTTTIAIRNRI